MMNREGGNKVPAKRFYSEWHGHRVEHLEALLPYLREASDSLIWTAGDSSLDNKYWFNDQKPAVGVYRDVLDPPVSKCDVTYWLNYLAQNLASRTVSIAAINTAVEATTLNERSYKLRPQDRFLRNNIRPNDILIVSVGGNDVALCPTPCTIVSMLGVLSLPVTCVENGFSCGVAPCNDCCCGCGPSALSCACTCPPCLGYFRSLFGVRVQKYIEALTSKTKPKKILVCMIYYPDEAQVPSWAGPALGALGYNSNPQKLQMLIRKAFDEATSTIRIKGSEVIPVPLFNALDGKNSNDYIARVEPSAAGGRKMAEFLLDIIDSSSGTLAAENRVNAPTTGLMSERK
mmetsp:Transcript_10908/g.19777  ORF Transcript_10908/g.19777 Transcript_10908/m.19777 type:complete len:345 (+) Transcript_10908:266-1300(+)|eukprot:CAMPEP_0202486728 /NCGR_PEP_ID=MMETSP1361-20130828/5216_1 /ASSEMBLY_ACC=CAM_ASM_000849 /TAXON_ID=210615 /ORGANISM="Staurosira complex sp., Strain CCMP2646" /LENGTH=344 /DNA_ID=CAMNT_0049115947 /DNA_START=204 /DNA_END=1238 /DNA_ORIENTATION=-